jgi:hypothetical protein
MTIRPHLSVGFVVFGLIILTAFWVLVYDPTFLVGGALRRGGKGAISLVATLVVHSPIHHFVLADAYRLRTRQPTERGPAMYVIDKPRFRVKLR